MKKIEIAQNWLNEADNLKWIEKELDLYLENNHGAETQEIYSLIEKDLSELGENYRTISKSECLKLKWTIIEDVMIIVQYGILWDNDTEIGITTIKKAMKETDFYNRFNNMFVENLQGEADNIAIFKRWFIR